MNWNFDKMDFVGDFFFVTKQTDNVIQCFPHKLTNDLDIQEYIEYLKEQKEERERNKSYAV